MTNHFFPLRLTLKTRPFNYKLNIFPKDINRTACLLTKKKDRKKEKEKSSTRPKTLRVKRLQKNTNHMPTGIQNIEETGSLTKPVDQKSFFNFLESSYYCEIKL